MPESSSWKAGFFRWLTPFVLILLGSACSAYLLARHFTLAGGSELFDICRAVFGGGCDEAISGDLAVQLGIPLAGWGLVHYAVVAVALMLALCLGEAFRSVGIIAALTLCVIATALGAVLTGVMLVAGAICPLCIVVHVLNLLLIPVILVASGRTISELRGSVHCGIQYLGGTDDEDPILARWKISGLVILALIGIVVYQWVLIQADRHALSVDSAVTFDQVLAEFQAAPALEIPWSKDDPRLGDRDESLELVIFSDFQCPACRRFSQIVAHVREDHPDLVVIFKHYPLGKACNPGVHVDLHPLSCAAAYAAEAARKQGKFWEYHNALFAADEPLEEDVLRRLAQSVGIDLARFDADRIDSATSTKVAADIALGKKLKIIGTPSAFLGKKPLSDMAMAQFEPLVDRLSEQARH